MKKFYKLPIISLVKIIPKEFLLVTDSEFCKFILEFKSAFLFNPNNNINEDNGIKNKGNINYRA